MAVPRWPMAADGGARDLLGTYLARWPDGGARDLLGAARWRDGAMAVPGTYLGAIQERLSTALRFERGQGYGVNVGLETIRGGSAFMSISTYVDAQSLADVLSTVRAHWQRWAKTGFDAGELNVALWQFTGQSAVSYPNGNAIAYRLLANWNAAPDEFLASGGRNTFRNDVLSIEADRLNHLFATCQANAVLGLTGHEPTVRQALQRSWPGTK